MCKKEKRRSKTLGKAKPLPPKLKKAKQGKTTKTGKKYARTLITRTTNKPATNENGDKVGKHFANTDGEGGNGDCPERRQRPLFLLSTDGTEMNDGPHPRSIYYPYPSGPPTSNSAIDSRSHHAPDGAQQSHPADTPREQKPCSRETERARRGSPRPPFDNQSATQKKGEEEARRNVDVLCMFVTMPGTQHADARREEEGERTCCSQEQKTRKLYAENVLS